MIYITKDGRKEKGTGNHAQLWVSLPNIIMIIRTDNFNLKQIADSGQCFRMNEIGNNTYSIIAYDRYIELRHINDNTIDISCDEEEYKAIWYEYFDMGYDYGKVCENLIHGDDEFLSDAASYGSGIRILKQEPFEILISFIISQNKNIPAIMSSIESICKMFGEERTSGLLTYYTFPTAKALSKASLDDLREARLGYRDKYVQNASKQVASGELDLEELKNMDHELAYKELNNIFGVGPKVANCVSLFGLHHLDMVPVDVWIKRILKEIYDNNFDWNKYKDYAGIVQQYMFYYMRYGYNNEE